MHNYLNETEKHKIRQFLADDTMREAVKKVLLSGVYYDGRLNAGEGADPQRNFLLGFFTNQKGMVPPPVSVMPDVELGQQLRALVHGISMVESGFKELEKLKEVEIKKEDNKNPAR